MMLKEAQKKMRNVEVDGDGNAIAMETTREEIRED